MTYRDIEALTEELEQARRHAADVRSLLWNASQARNAGSVIRLGDQLDAAVDRVRRLERQLAKVDLEVATYLADAGYPSAAAALLLETATPTRTALTLF